MPDPTVRIMQIFAACAFGGLFLFIWVAAGRHDRREEDEAEGLRPKHREVIFSPSEMQGLDGERLRNPEHRNLHNGATYRPTAWTEVKGGSVRIFYIRED